MREIILGDSLGVLPQLDVEVDLVLTDPPYNISTEVRINRGSQGKYKGKDVSSDFGIWDHFESDREFFQFTKSWVTLCAELIKPGGYFISFFDKRRISWIFDILEPMGFKVRDVATWVKNNPVPQVRKVKMAQATEMVAILSKEGPNQYQWSLGYHPNYKKVPIVGGHERLKDENGDTLHMTQKPERIIRWLMDYHCMPGGLVLDPFSGTGTVAVEAIRSGRQYICVEREEKYYLASLGRIAHIQPDLFPVDYKSSDYKRKYL